MKQKLIAGECQLSGEIGWFIDGVPRFEDNMVAALGTERGTLIAHDLVEHMNGLRNIGTIHDEMEALGAIMFVRGWTGVLDKHGMSRYSVEENIASDLSRMFGEWGSDDYYMPVPKVTREARKRLDLEDEVIDTIIEHTVRLVYEEEFDLSYHEVTVLLKEYVHAARHFMRIGFRKARGKYRGDRNHAYSLFWAIAEAVDRIGDPEWEGQEVLLTYNTRTGETFAEEIYDDEY